MESTKYVVYVYDDDSLIIVRYFGCDIDKALEYYETINDSTDYIAVIEEEIKL